MEDDTEPMFLLFKTYEVTVRTLTADTGAKDITHALRPVEGATDPLGDPATFACDNDELLFGNRRSREIGPANKVSCPRCLIAISLA